MEGEAPPLTAEPQKACPGPSDPSAAAGVVVVENSQIGDWRFSVHVDGRSWRVPLAD
jgi:hypothetical protein